MPTVADAAPVAPNSGPRRKGQTALKPSKVSPATRKAWVGFKRASERRFPGRGAKVAAVHQEACANLRIMMAEREGRESRDEGELLMKFAPVMFKRNDSLADFLTDDEIAGRPLDRLMWPFFRSCLGGKKAAELQRALRKFGVYVSTGDAG